VVRKSVTPSDKRIGRSLRPMIRRVKDPIQGGPLAMLDNVREPLVPLAPFTSRLKEVLELRGLFFLSFVGSQWQISCPVLLTGLGTRKTGLPHRPLGYRDIWE